MKKKAGLNIDEMYPSRGVDALDMECISLEDAGLTVRENDTVPGMQRAHYYDEEGDYYA